MEQYIFKNNYNTKLIKRKAFQKEKSQSIKKKCRYYQTFLVFFLAIAVVLYKLWTDTNEPDEIDINNLHDKCVIPLDGEDKCQYVLNHCKKIKGLFNYLPFVYCTMKEHENIAFIIIVIWIIWLFLLFGTSSSNYFSPNLTVIANYLNLPESVAGVTLAALGNGAPDVFGTFSAFKANSGGLAIGELIGASLFVTILVIGCISLVAPLKVTKKPFLRDMAFFIGAVLCVLVIIVKGYINMAGSIFMLTYYIVYVILVMSSNWQTHIKESKMAIYRHLGFHFPRSEFESGSESKKK